MTAEFLRRGIVLLAGLSLAAGAWAESAHNAGFALAEGKPAAFAVWYPSVDAETSRELGPFRPTWAWDGRAAEGKFPVVLLSHGNGGRLANHRDTAATLARRGMIVVAPQHNDSAFRSGKDIDAGIAARVNDLHRALEWVKSHPTVGGHADGSRVFALGYSLGTWTALAAAGATPSMLKFNTHCDRHGADDIHFCYGGNRWVAKFFIALRSGLQWLRDKDMLKPRPPVKEGEDFSPVESPIPFRAIALVAPVGAPFPKKSLRRLDGDVAIYRLGDDEELRSPHHAEWLRDALGDRARYKNYPGVHHLAFISPFPPRFLEAMRKEGEDTAFAEDPEGFDRRAFLAAVNQDIAEFFAARLREE